MMTKQVATIPSRGIPSGDRRKKKQKAWAITTLVALICLALFGTKYWLLANYGSMRSPTSYPLLPFVAKDSQDSLWTRHRIWGAVHMAILAPKDCSDSCRDLNRQLLEWTEDKLMRHEQAYDTRPLNILFFDHSNSSGADPELRIQNSLLTRFSAAAWDEIFSPSLPAEENTKDQPSSAKWLIINQEAEIAYIFRPEDEQALAEVKAIISKMAFNHYLDDYLAKRTFFGPRKDKDAVKE
jgi:hypothetical protein